MKRIAVFASGNGSNYEALVRACEEGTIPAEVALVVCDRPEARVVRRAASHATECFAFDPKSYGSKTAYETEIVRRLETAGVELVCLAGYMRICGPTLLRAYGGRIVNIHPALLPAFKGAHAIRDAFDYGVKVYGVTIHYVDDTVDGGRIIAQQAVPYEGSDIDELEALIHAAEHPLYVETVRRLLSEDPAGETNGKKNENGESI